MFASKEGTETFKDNAIGNNNVHPSNYKQIFDLYLSSIGIGTYLGAPTPEVDKMVEQAVKTCIRSGVINVINTAINYRFQRAEKSIGKALQELINNEEIKREQIFISTKNGYIALAEEKYYMNMNEYVYEQIVNQYICRKEDIVGGIHCMSPLFLEFQLEQSLKNLNVESIDLFYLHNAAETQLEFITPIEFYERLEDAFLFFEKMRDINRI